MYAHKMVFGRYDFANFFGLGAYATTSVIVPIVLVALAGNLGFPLEDGGKSAGGALQFGRSVPMIGAMLFCGFSAGYFGKIRSLGVAMLFMCGGILLAACSNSYWPLFAAIAIAGLGEGVVEGLLTPLVQDLHKDEPGRYINFTHSFWSIGVVFTVLVAGALLLRGVNWRWILGGCALFALIPALMFLLPSKKSKAAPHRKLSFATVFGHAAGIVRIGRFWLFFVTMFLAGGGEFCLTFWVSSFIQLDYGANALMGALGTAFFAGGMIAGRMGSGVLIKQKHLLQLILLTALFGTLLGIFPPFLTDIWVLFGVLFFLGIATGPFWPSIQSYCVEQFEHCDSTMIFILLSCAGIPGSGFFAWLMGFTGDHVGLRASFFLVPLCYGGLGLLIAIDALRHRKKQLPS
jgi:MFS family permease